MNLVLSGPIDESLRNLVVALTKPRRVVRLHARADRMEGAADDPSIRSQVGALCDAARVDHAYLEEGITFADFKLLAMDMDSTLITIECIDEIADYAGKKAEVSAITEAAMRGEIDFAASLKLRVSALRGTPAAVLQRVYDERLQLTDGAEKLLRHARELGIKTMLLSGGFTYFTERLKTKLLIDSAYANQLEIDEDVITGRVLDPILDPDAKARYVRDALYFAQEPPQCAIVIGDGANDIPMMNEVRYSIAYHANAAVLNSAHTAIKFGTLETVLHYFG